MAKKIRRRESDYLSKSVKVTDEKTGKTFIIEKGSKVEFSK